MNGHKSISYELNPSSEEVNLLVAELTELFVNKPELASKLSNLYLFTKKLSELLGTQDFNNSRMEELRKSIKENGIRDLLNPVATRDAEPSDTESVKETSPQVEKSTSTKKKGTKEKTSKSKKLEVVKNKNNG